jgi:hypothetical protein
MTAQNYVGPRDDLKRIRGIGVLIEKRLNSLGYYTYGHMANWTPDDLEKINENLGFKGRAEKENWIEQARILAGKDYVPPTTKKPAPPKFEAGSTGAYAKWQPLDPPYSYDPDLAPRTPGISMKWVLGKGLMPNEPP